MNRIKKQSDNQVTLVMGCDAETARRVDAIAARDGVSRARALRELVLHALPAFEADGAPGAAPEPDAMTPTEPGV